MGSTHLLSDLTSPKYSKTAITAFIRDNGVAILRDWVGCWILAGIAAGIHSLPIYRPDNRIVLVYLGPSGQLTFPTRFLYPKKDALVSTSLCTFLTGVMPSLVITMFQIKIRSTLDWRVGTTGVMKAVLYTTIISVCLKHFVGGFRPHYIDVCQPDLTLLTNLKAPSNTTWWMSPKFCTGNEKAVYEALRGMPSGHAASSFAAAVFLSLYLNAKLKLFSDFAPRTLGLAGLITPLLLASLMSGSQYVTHQHHAHEILIGILIGIVTGICSYRLRYAAIFDFRYNHIPLTTILSAIDDAPKVRPFRMSNDEKRRLGEWWARLSEREEEHMLEDVCREEPKYRGRCFTWW